MKDYVLTLLVTAVVTYMLTPLVRKIAIRAGALHEARDRDVHVVPIPRFGGVAMFGGLAAGLFVADQLPQLRDGFANTGMITGLLAAGGLLVIIGVVDDRWGMSALTKFAGQVAAGGILVATGTQLNWLPLPGGRTFVPTADQATLVTILVVVATINAVNFIDGLDGLAAGIVAIAAVSFFLYYYSMTRVIDISSLAAPALASALLIGMCLGFLPHNFWPAKIFMGDTGSMLLGLLLAYAPISSISSLDPAVLASRINRYPEIMPLLLPAALLVIPYADLLLAVVRRTRAGTSPFAADRKHLHHRLLDIGHSQRASVLIMYLWAALFSGSVVWLSIEKTAHVNAVNHHGQPVLVFVAITAGAVVALLLISMPKLRLWEVLTRRRRDREPPGQPRADQLAKEPEPAVVGTRLTSDAYGGKAGARSGADAHWMEPAAGEPAGSEPAPDRSGATLLNAEWAANQDDPPQLPGGGELPPRSIIGHVPPAVTDQGQAPDALTDPSVSGRPPAEPLTDRSWAGPLSRRASADSRTDRSWTGPLSQRASADSLTDRSRRAPLPGRYPAGPGGGQSGQRPPFGPARRPDDLAGPTSGARP